MKNKWKYNYYRKFQTHCEQKANCEIREDGERIKWGRPSRNPYRLDSWTLERPYNHQKSWKKQRKTKYHPSGVRNKNTKHSIFLIDRKQEYRLTEYLRKNRISFRSIRKGRKLKKYYLQTTRREFVGCKDFYIKGLTNRYLQPVYEDVPLEKPILRSYYLHYTDGWLVTWWYHKDIGVNFIIKGDKQ